MSQHTSSAHPPQPVGWMGWVLALLGLGLVVVIVCVGPGCGTLLNQNAIGNRTRPYGGVRNDFLLMAEEPATIPIFVVDLPLSFVGDTLCLPTDLWRNDPPTNKTQGGSRAVPPAESR